MIKAQLLALKQQGLCIAATCDALLASIEPPKPPAPDPTTTKCPHPQEQRVSTAGMGHPESFLCNACGQEVTGVNAGPD